MNGKTHYVVERNACPIGFAVDQVITEDDLKKIDVSERGLVLLRSAVIQPDDCESVSDLAPCISYRTALESIQTDAGSDETADTGSNKLDPSDNAGLVFDSDQEGYSPSGRDADNLSKSSPGEKIAMTDDELQDVAAERVAYDSGRAVENFQRTSDGFVCESDYPDNELVYFSVPNDSGWKAFIDGKFVCESDYPDNELVYFSVPNDSGWKAFIDGKETAFINSGGMMMIRVPAGEHSIEFHYTTPGLSAGAAISLLSLGALVLFAIADRKKRSLNCRSFSSTS